MKPNDVLIDYENVQPDTAEELAPPHFKVLLFAGASQPRVNIDVASALQAKGADARYVRISGTARNALDTSRLLGELVDVGCEGSTCEPTSSSHAKIATTRFHTGLRT